ELDSLADAVRARAEDHDSRHLARGRCFVCLAPGGVVVRRRRLDLAGARIDAAVGGVHAAGPALCPDGVLGGGAPRCDLGVGPPLTLEPEKIVRDEVVELAD